MSPRWILFGAVLLAFGASLTQGFHFDDYSVVHGIRWAEWPTRPLTWLTFEANARTGAHPALWHAVSFALHLCAVLLLFELFQRMMPTNAALLGAAIFAVHPIQAESVAYVFSRPTLLSTLFSIAACLAWIKGKRWLAVAWFALALLSKEDCATVPLVILLFDRGWGRDKLAPLATMFAMVGAVAVNTLLATRAIAGSGAGFTAGISPGLYLLDQGFVIVRYLQLVAIPFGFTIDPEIKVSTGIAVAAWAVLLILATWRVRRHDYWFGAGLLLLLPSSSFFPLADLAADHRMYLPMTAFASGAGLLLARLPRWSGVAFVVVLIGFSAERMMVWGSDETLWTEAADRAPDKVRPRIQLARALPPPRALELMKRTQITHPGDLNVDAELGRVYLELGQPALALSEFGKVLGQHPRDPHAINNRGVALRALNQEDAAQQDFKRSLKIDPCLEEARRNLGLPPCAR